MEILQRHSLGVQDRYILRFFGILSGAPVPTSCLLLDIAAHHADDTSRQQGLCNYMESANSHSPSSRTTCIHVCLAPSRNLSAAAVGGMNTYVSELDGISSTRAYTEASPQYLYQKSIGSFII